MNVNDKIIFLDGMFPSVLFPVGLPKDGGTCAYLTEYCLEYCPTAETNIHEKRALDFFKKNTEDVIVNKILEDMTAYNLMHLYWWSWGDCLPELTEKITNIMFKLSKVGILQNGYTRNKSLWYNINFPQKVDNLRIGFHVDSVKELMDPEYKDKVICCPDITVNKAEMYFNGVKIGRCCGIWTDWLTVEETRASDCQECYMFKQGCFYDGKGKS